MANLTPALSCSPHTWTDCVSNFCCLNDANLDQVIAYLMIQATRYSGYTAQQIIAMANSEDTLPASFTEHDYKVAFACVAASLAGNTDGGLDILKAAQQVGYNQVSPDALRIITLIAICYLTASQEQ